MKVSKLIEELQALDPEMKVIVAADEEGNSFRELDQVDVSHYEQDGWEFNVFHPSDVDDDDDYPQGVVLWP
jgi:hypothetical protein